MDKTIRISSGNCLKLFQTIPDKTIDLVIANPPYNLGKDYGNKSDNQDFEGYIKFSRQWLSEACRVLKATGTIYVFVGFRYISYIYQILESDLGMQFRNWICWHYTQGIGKTMGFSPRHDDILMFTKGKTFTFNLDAVRVPQKYYRSVNNMRGANPGDVWEVSHIHYCQENRQQHPTQKPEALMERMVLASTNEQDSVLDPFSGSGTTLRVCQQLNRKCIGFEINPKYVELIQERLSKEFVGFDSIDERMLRVPNDLNDESIRAKYIENHIKWFLANHPDRVEAFLNDVRSKYGMRMKKRNKDHTFVGGQSLFPVA